MNRIRVTNPKEKNMKWLYYTIFFIVLAASVYVFLPAEEPASFEIGVHSGKVEIFVKDENKWTKPKRGMWITPGDKIRTGPDSEAEIQVPGQVRLRIKEDSVFEFKGQDIFNKGPQIRLGLDQGTLYAATLQDFADNSITLLTPKAVATTSGSYFRAEVDPKTGESHIGVLRGSLKVGANSRIGSKAAVIREHEKAALDIETGMVKATPISREEWQNLKETYELTQKSAAVEAAQLDLSKGAGNLFEFVFDHGTFYTPKFGYAGREFFKDGPSDEVVLEAEYDVFPKGSFVGVYIKTRKFDVSKFEELRFDVRRVRDEGFPINVRIELKSKSGVVRAFASKMPKKQWTQKSFPLRVNKPTEISEITLVFAHDRVGEFKKGLLQLRNFHLVPRTDMPEVPVKEPVVKEPEPAVEAEQVSPITPVEPPVITEETQTVIEEDRESSGISLDEYLAEEWSAGESSPETAEKALIN